MNNNYTLDYTHPVHIHFIGIGGISMSGLAKIVAHRGFTVTGSDDHESVLTKELESLGCRIDIGLKASNITDDIDAVVYTAAIHPDNPEFAACVAKNIPMLTRAEFLGQIMKNYKTAIGVSGTHGKTTTTSMISEILMLADTDPTISVGGMLPSIGGNLRIGESDMFLTEACEYTNSFLSFAPTVDVILNVEEDHLDFFKDLNDIRLSFKKYVELLDENGYLIVNSDIENYEYFFSESDCHVVTFGTNPEVSDYSAGNIVLNETGFYSYDLLYMGKTVSRVNLKVPGKHNIYNSVAAIATMCTVGIEPQIAVAGIEKYTGVDRRFQIKGNVNGFTVVDDYAHHPSEICATLTAATDYPHKKLWVIFQPHTYTRTKAFLQDFADALSKADHVILAKIYEAREKDIYGVSSDDIRKLIEKNNVPCEYITDFADIEKFVIDNCKEGDLVITMGAGNIIEVGENLIKNNN